MERKGITTEFRAQGGMIDDLPKFRHESFHKSLLSNEPTSISPRKKVGIGQLVILRQTFQRHDDRGNAPCREFAQRPSTGATQGNRRNGIEMGKDVVDVFGGPISGGWELRVESWKLAGAGDVDDVAEFCQFREETEDNHIDGLRPLASADDEENGPMAAKTGPAQSLHAGPCEYFRANGIPGDNELSGFWKSQTHRIRKARQEAVCPPHDRIRLMKNDGDPFPPRGDAEGNAHVTTLSKDDARGVFPQNGNAPPECTEESER